MFQVIPGTPGDVLIILAGHLPPFLNGEAIPLEGSLPLGLTPDTAFPVTHLQLQEGDDLTLYTDGVLEAQRKSRELFGFNRTAALLHFRPLVRTIAEIACTFGQTDDITIVKIVRSPTEATQSHISIDLQTVSSQRRMPHFKLIPAARLLDPAQVISLIVGEHTAGLGNGARHYEAIMSKLVLFWTRSGRPVMPIESGACAERPS